MKLDFMFEDMEKNLYRYKRKMLTLETPSGSINKEKSIIMISMIVYKITAFESFYFILNYMSCYYRNSDVCKLVHSFELVICYH